MAAKHDLEKDSGTSETPVTPPDTPADAMPSERQDLLQGELARDMQAALAARQQLGPAYDQQLVAAFVERAMAQLQAQMEAQLEEARQHRKVAQRQGPPPHDQRLALAIVSLALLIPLVALVSGLGLVGVALVCLLVVAVNLAFRYL